MKKLSPCLFAIVFCNLFTILASGQSEKISINIVPKPNQTIRMTMTQEGEINVNFEGDVPEALGAMKTMKMVTKSVIGMSQKNGPLDKDGQFEAEITYETVNSEITMNGTPIPVGAEMEKLVGKKIKAIYNSKGEVVDFKTSDDLGIPIETFKLVMQSIYGNMPKKPMSIGETVDIPLNMDFPIPIPGAEPIKLQGQTKTKLVAVENDANGRIAKFDQTTEAKLINKTETDSPSGKVAIGMDFKMNGTGNLQLNLDKGLLKESGMKIDIDGKINLPTAVTNVQIPPMALKGAMKVTILGTN